ncbi:MULTISPECIES: helix-turn-helix domain-containing protein [unclassified Sedimentibacter]|uniref:helix-turn-helix domain-containing protein n=1 Tax=unclassified Sedimentibacter TaxID=2649220 RepID=UPI0027E1DE8D|nr:helix-turn-helix transcriptional regulator [Sedimentibacter sp. MB35-C1]WMJ77210.1 helix-turn-helix transcriptional regulator [Sedimentibacter sp. MB35-C1]
MNEFLTPGQRIKKIRKLLNLKQYDLQGKKVKRNFISMIENGKRGLSIETARYLAEKFNNRANELKINLHIDESNLLMTQEEEARQYCLNKLKDNPNLETIDFAFDVSVKFNLIDVGICACIKKGDYYFNYKEYSKAAIYYVKALNNINITDKKNESYIFNRLGLCKMNELYYAEALEFFNMAYSSAILNDDLLTRKNSIYNISLCYRKLYNFKSSIKYINEFLILCDKDIEDTNYVYASVIKANNYRDLKEFDKALNIYENLLVYLNNDKSSDAAYVYDNIGLLYCEYFEYEKALKCLEVSQKIRTEIDIENLAKSLIDKANILIMQNKNDEALILINLGIDLAKKHKDFEYELKGYYLIIDIHKKTGDIKKLENIYLKVLNIAKVRKDYKEIIDISSKLCLIYLDENDIKKAKNILTGHII